MINHAGIENEVPTTEMTLDNWNKVMSTKLMGMFLGCRDALKYMTKNGIEGSPLLTCHRFISKFLGLISFIMQQVKEC